MAKIESYPTATPVLADMVPGTDAGDANATKNFTFEAIRDFISGQHADVANVPAATNSPGVAGQLAVGSVGVEYYLYVCVATNSWKRVAITGWV